MVAPSASALITPRRLLFAACVVASALTVASLLCAIGARSDGGQSNGQRSGGEARRGLVRRQHPGGRRPTDRRVAEEERVDDEERRPPGGGDFFERNGLPVPPLANRRERLRLLQEDADGQEGADENTSDTDIEKADAASTPLMNVDESSGLDASTLLRRELLRPETYDRHAYPWSYAWAGRPEGQRTGLPVEVGVNFHRVFSVDVINPVLGEFLLRRALVCPEQHQRTAPPLPFQTLSPGCGSSGSTPASPGTRPSTATSPRRGCGSATAGPAARPPRYGRRTWSSGISTRDLGRASPTPTPRLATTAGSTGAGRDT